jgi:hypothetical protein
MTQVLEIIIFVKPEIIVLEFAFVNRLELKSSQHKSFFVVYW